MILTSCLLARPCNIATSGLTDVLFVGSVLRIVSCLGALFKKNSKSTLFLPSSFVSACALCSSQSFKQPIWCSGRILLLSSVELSGGGVTVCEVAFRKQTLH